MNIVEPILFQCRLNPWGAAICTPGSAIDTVNYGQLESAIHNVATAALKHDLRPRQLVSIFLKNTIHHAALVLALTRLGIATMSGRFGKISPGLKIDAVVTDDPGSSPGAANVIAFEPNWLMGDGTPPDYDSIHRTANDDLCRIVLTSGTTGNPKAVAFTHKAMLDRNSARLYSKGSRYPFSSRLFCDLGISSSPGFSYMMSMLSRGGTVYFLGDDPSYILAFLDLHKIQSMATTPYGLSQFVQYFERDAAYECSFDHIICQGAMLSNELSKRVRTRMCQNLYSSYGSTEASTAAFGPAEAISKVPGAVGYLMPGVAVETVDDAGKVLPSGREGAIRIRTPHIASGYLGDPEATALAFRDGFFYPGDFGHVTREGLLVIGGREKTVLNLGGDTIRPEVVEDALTAHQGIDQAAAFSMKDEFGVAELCVLVVPRGPFDESETRTHCKEKLPAWAMPVHFFVVDAIPRTVQGKIERHRLADLAKRQRQ